MRRRPSSLAALSLLALALLTGCGGGGHPTTTTTAAATTTASSTTSAAATTASTTAAAGTTTSGAATGLGGLAGVGKCSQLAGLYAAVASALTGANNNVQKEQQILQQFAAKTPPAIRADFQTLAAAFSKIAAAYKGSNLSSGASLNPAALAKLAAIASQFNSPALTQAEHAISAWAAQNCHA